MDEIDRQYKREFEQKNKREIDQQNNRPNEIPGFKPVTFQPKERRQKVFNRSDPYEPPEKDTRFQVNKPETTVDKSYSKMRQEQDDKLNDPDECAGDVKCQQMKEKRQELYQR